MREREEIRLRNEKLREEEKMMSLVDYASSSDEDDDVREDKPEQPKAESKAQIDQPSPLVSVPSRSQINESSSHRFPEPAVQLPAPSFDRLPDASVLLNSPNVSLSGSGSDHSSRVAAAMAESASRKRDSNGLPYALNRSKLQKGNLRHSKNVPDTDGGLLVPPQLSGRSNVVTEDVSKLFVKKTA